MRLNGYGQNYSPTTMKMKKYGEGEAVSDDIVTQLRSYDIGSVAHESEYHMTEVLAEAADEIERLRAEVARLNAFLHPIGMVINREVRGE